MAVIELVINPVAGKGRALRIGEEAAALLKSRGIDFAKHLTDHPRHATGAGARGRRARGGNRDRPSAATARSPKRPPASGTRARRWA